MGAFVSEEELNDFLFDTAAPGGLRRILEGDFAEEPPTDLDGVLDRTGQSLFEPPERPERPHLFGWKSELERLFEKKNRAQQNET